MKPELIKLYKLILTREQLIFQIRLYYISFLSDFNHQLIENIGKIKKDFHFIYYSILKKEEEKELLINYNFTPNETEFNIFQKKIELLFIHTFRFFKNYFPNNALRIQNEHLRILNLLKKLSSIQEIMELSKSYLFEELRKCFTNISLKNLFVNLQYCEKDAKNSKFFSNKDKKDEFEYLLKIQQQYMLNIQLVEDDNYDILDKISTPPPFVYIDNIINYNFEENPPKNFKLLFKFDEFNIQLEYLMRELLSKNTLVQQTIRQYLIQTAKRNKVHGRQQTELPDVIIRTPRFDLLNNFHPRGNLLKNQFSNITQHSEEIEKIQLKKQNSLLQKRSDIQSNYNTPSPYLNFDSDQVTTRDRYLKIENEKAKVSSIQFLIFQFNSLIKPKLFSIKNDFGEGISKSFLVQDFKKQNLSVNQYLFNQAIETSTKNNCNSQNFIKTEGNEKSKYKIQFKKIMANYYEPNQCNQQSKQYLNNYNSNYIKQTDGNRFILKRRQITVQDSLKFLQ